MLKNSKMTFVYFKKRLFFHFLKDINVIETILFQVEIFYIYPLLIIKSKCKKYNIFQKTFLCQIQEQQDEFLYG